MNTKNPLTTGMALLFISTFVNIVLHLILLYYNFNLLCIVIVGVYWILSYKAVKYIEKDSELMGVIMMHTMD
jgi:hypothetical protein